MSYVGCLVSLDCGEVLGTYQGQVKNIDNSSQLLTICQAFRNGIKCEVPEITINAKDIKELKIVKSSTEAQTQLPKQATPSKLSKETAKELDYVPSPGRIREVTPTATREATTNECGDSGFNSINGQRNYSNHESYNSGYAQSSSSNNYMSVSDRYMQEGNGHVSPLRHTPTKDRGEECNYRNRGTPNRDRSEEGFNGNGNRNGARHTPTKDENFRGRKNSASERTHRSSVPRKIEFRKKQQTRQDCFSAPVDSFLDDFDFEKNLALFDKKAVFEEIESAQPEEVRAVDKKPSKYRCDENVLQSGPVVLQQIKIPNQSGQIYVTDSGLVIPSIDYDLKNRLFTAAEQCGFSVDRRLEMIGRSSSEMVLQLIGGSSRLNPQNGHQLPTIVVLCGPHIQGAQGLNCARHLVNHGVKTIVFLPNFIRMVQCVEQELKLFEMCGGKRYSTAQDIPTCAVDMIINCMDSHENSVLQEQNWYQAHIKWATENRAQVFAIDPPMESVPIQPKWCLWPCLPLALVKNSAQAYLCDLGLPKKVFKDVGITYKSPFSHKFIIPIHEKR